MATRKAALLRVALRPPSSPRAPAPLSAARRRHASSTATDLAASDTAEEGWNLREQEDPAGMKQLRMRHRHLKRLEEAGQQPEDQKDTVLISYIPPYEEGKPLGAKLRKYIGAALNPTHEPVSSWPLGQRLREGMGQYIADRLLEKKLVPELFPAPKKSGYLYQFVTEAETLPFLEKADESWRAMHTAFAEGTLDSLQSSIRPHDDLTPSLQAKRSSLLSAFPSGTTLEWTCWPESDKHPDGAPIGTIVAATRREIDIDRPVAQVVVRYRSWQRLIAKDVKGRILKGGPEDLKLVMEYWVYQRKDWRSTDSAEGWKLFRQVYEDPKPDWLVY